MSVDKITRVYLIIKDNFDLLENNIEEPGTAVTKYQEAILAHPGSTITLMRQYKRESWETGEMTYTYQEVMFEQIQQVAEMMGPGPKVH